MFFWQKPGFSQSQTSLKPFLALPPLCFRNFWTFETGWPACQGPMSCKSKIRSRDVEGHGASDVGLQKRRSCRQHKLPLLARQLAVAFGFADAPGRRWKSWGDTYDWKPGLSDVPSSSPPLFKLSGWNCVCFCLLCFCFFCAFLVLDFLKTGCHTTARFEDHQNVFTISSDRADEETSGRKQSSFAFEGRHR